MTKEQTNRLIDAVKEGLHRTGMTQKELARRGGTSSGQLSGALSGALSGGVTMSPTKWEMCCEALGIDYKALMAEGEPVAATDEPEEEKTWTRVLPPEETEEVDQHNDQGEEMVEMRTRLSRALEENAELKNKAKEYQETLEKLLQERNGFLAELAEQKCEAGKQQDVIEAFRAEVQKYHQQLSEAGEKLKDREEAIRMARIQAETHLQSELKECRDQLIKLKAAMFDQEHPELA